MSHRAEISLLFLSLEKFSKKLMVEVPLFFFFQHTCVTTPQVDGAQEINNVAILGSQWKSLCKRMENAKFPGKVVSVNVDSYNREMF